MRAAALAVGLLWAVGCALPADDSPPGSETADALPDPDRLEEEPNEDQAQDLGWLVLPLVLGGTSEECGEDGSFTGADVDRFSFQLETAEILEIRLIAPDGDLDLELSNPTGDVLAAPEVQGNGDEVIEVALSPQRQYTAKIRCWMGEMPAWRLVFTVLD